MSGYDVVGCSDCSNLWILPTHDRQTNVVAECPCCGNGHRTSKLRPLEHHETRAGAAELRSRRLAKRAGESEVYENLLEDVGPFNAQQDEIERQIERDAPISAEKMDLTPIESDRYEDLAKTVLEPDRRKFEEWAEEYAGLYEDAFETEVSTDRPGDELFAEEIADDLESWASRADRDELSRGEVTLTDQQPASAAAIVDLETTTVTDLWTALFGHDDVRAALAQSLADLFGGMEPVECYDVLEEYGIPFWVRSHIVNVARGYASDSVTCDGPADPRRVVDEIIAPLPENPLAETVDLLAVASLFDGLETEPVIGVVVRDAFVDDVRRDQRVDVCDLLAVLADACSVRLVGSTVTLGKVANSHRSDLPGVSEWCNRNREVQQIDAAQRQVATALERGDFAVTMLRELSRDPNGILSYSELYSLYPGDDDSRVRQLVSEYVDLELVDRFGPRTDRKVELLPAGERVLELYETEIARQRSISDFVSGGGKQQQQGRVPTRSGVGGEAEADAVTADGTAPYRTRYMAPDEHAAAAACGQNGGVTLVRGPVADHERRTRYASYDPERGEAVAAVRAGGPLPLTTSAALALASPEFVDRALPADKLESIDDPPVIVRDARCIGGASDRALEDGQEFRETLIEWGAEIADMTTKLNHGDHDALDRAQFRSEIIRSAQGLWGTITHLLDLFGIDVHYEIRVPENTDQDDLDALAKSIGYAAAIQSTYNGHYACYRQLFEDREDKRRTAFTAQVDAADPTGSLIPSFVVRGPDVHRLEDSLRTYLESPTEVHDDAPEFGVDIPIRTDPGRDAYDAAIRRVLSRKNIRTTTEAVSTLHGLVATPHDAARVLHRRLSSEAEARDVRPDELRRALQALEPIAILPQLGSADRRTDTAGKIVQTLLAADDPLSKSELAERAGVSKKTVYNYREQLEPLGIMVVDEGGYRIGLSAPTSDGRESRTYPTAVGARFTEAVDAVLERRLPTDRYADPDDPIGGLLFWSDGDPPNPWALLDHPDYGPIARLARRLTNGQRTRPAETAVLMGPEMKQKSLEGAAVSASAD